MKKNTIFGLIVLVAVIAMGLMFTSCDVPTSTSTNNQKSVSGVQKMNVEVKTDADGYTSEQKNIAAKLAEDNKPGAIKHLYIISAYSGDVILYSAVKGKVTSSGKRLSPTTVVATEESHTNNASSNRGIRVNISGRSYYTTEVLQDDGTYGSSIPYLYWSDTKGVMHKHYPEGGQIIHISSQPIVTSKPIITIDTYNGK
jgi:hypothetical protein